VIKPEQIPDEVVEAFVDAYYTKDMTRKAAISAAINAWPGARKDYRFTDFSEFLNLPLLHENNDD
jgi:hypothetical protein